jgi:O-methyltransferase
MTDDEIVEFVRPYTMTSPERIRAMCNAVRHVCRESLPGDIVECGVWRGGSMMAAALTLIEEGELRTLRLFDTFSGMTAPGEKDGDTNDLQSGALAVGVEEVSRNLSLTGYPRDHIRMVAGPVEETLPSQEPNQIAVLRLDTDWYASTLHELRHLYPRLSVGGVLIVDDYGHWRGARQAVDEYFAGCVVEAERIDYTGIKIVKGGG